MRLPTLRDGVARAAVTVGGVLPYLPVLSLDRIYVTDDVFTSDIFNGELPAKVLAGQLMAAGQAPVWSSKLCSGMPLAPTGVFEPISLGLFAKLHTAPALCLLVIVIALVAAHGAYALSRRLGADRVGAVLAGVAFAGSGYVVTQLKHLSIVMTVVWLPWGLLLLDRALASQVAPRIGADEDAIPSPSVFARMRDMGLFGLVFAEQIMAGFPQSVYISGLVYGAWALLLLPSVRGRVGRLPLGLVLGSTLVLAVALAAMCGAPMLLPLSELGTWSDRRGQLSWEFASMAPYAWRDILNFLIPYANGDIANSTYHGEGIFWENYGYVGAATFILALWAVIRAPRRPRVLLLFCMAIIAMSMVLGPHTPVYHLAWKYMPGMGRFRFPTRFLFVVDLVIAVLGAIGLGLLRKDLTRLLANKSTFLPALVCVSVTIGTALDLFGNQSHQNPFVPADEWLTPPKSVTGLGVSAKTARFFTPLHNEIHMLAFRVARGWENLDPYRALRSTVAPNTGVYWGVSTADCYTGISPAWFVDVWGDHSRYGIVIQQLMRLGRESIETSPGYSSVLAAYGVTHVLSQIPITDGQLKEVPNAGGIHMYEVPGKRVRVVANAKMVTTNREAASIIMQHDFDPDRDLLLHKKKTDTSLNPVLESLDPRTQAAIVAEDSRHLRVEVTAPQGGYLLLADTFYPGWHARVDGVKATLYRANISARAVRLPPGARSVQFEYDAAPFFNGVKFAGAGLSLLLIWIVTFSRAASRRLRPEPLRNVAAVG